MKTFVAFVLLCAAVARAQVVGDPGFYGPSYPGYGYRYNRGCPVDLLYQLSNIVEELYGYGQPITLGGYGGAAFGGYGGGAAYSAGVGYQAAAGTGNPYNPVCPWPLINGMIQQIAQYVNQMENAQGVAGAGNIANTGFGYSPFGSPNMIGAPFGGAMGAGPFRRRK